MRILIVDDEPLARQRLRGLVEALAGGDGGLRVDGVAEAGDADAAVAALQAEPADLVLLDIQLPGRDGLRLAPALQALPRPPLVVFVTAHGEHALRAFELQALDYLTKPVRRERLQAALQRAVQQLALVRGVQPPVVPEPVLVLSERGRVLRLPVREALVLKAEQKYVTLRTAQQTFVLDDSLSDLERRLGPGFVRVHRNALVAVTAIRELQPHALGDEGDGWAVRVAPLDEWLAVSRRQLAAVRSALQGVPGGPAR
ncbi:MAG: LytTR family DNA-binding domain-containing protein [Burkholderiaceae bacterium]|jgi:two-component system response regulator AlgR|nr:LytTR family DNA-binding domain-containing protein [Burkholderiaceae bacterium]MCZ8174688.1 LytTR family DNA-binding domain-containing protein [Burkholderiaceae bacterium]